LRRRTCPRAQLRRPQTVVDQTKEGAEKTKDAVVKGTKTAVDKTKDGLGKTGEVITDGWITTRS